MSTRDERKAAAASNLALMRGAFSKDTQETIDAAIIYEDGEGRELELPEVEEGAATTTSVTSDFAVKAVHSAKGKTVVVDPCSFMRPGGAYEDAFGEEREPEPVVVTPTEAEEDDEDDFDPNDLPEGITFRS